MVNKFESAARTVNSQSGMLLRAAQLLADIQHRSSSDTGVLLRELIEGAAGLVPGAQYAGITVTKPQCPSETAAATHRYPAVLDIVQDHYRQGPCLSAAAQQDRVRVDDLGTDERWPLYREEALRQTPIRSILSCMMFATHAALVWNMVRRDQQFRTALVSRDIIGQAKGMLMERFNIDAAEAFRLLTRLSQESNTRVAQLAQQVVAGDHAPR